MFLADLHIHSKYARATSKECIPECLDLWAGKKGLDLIGTGDLTHPGWREELREKLELAEDGFYRLKKEYRLKEAVHKEARFVMTGEISSIYKKNGKVRKIHNVIILPSLEAADLLSNRLEGIGANIRSDGRPILGLDSRDLLEMTLETDERAIFIPAHIWTPHFSLFGAYSGFDDIEECFEDLTPHIHALETGLSSDPPMNWRISALDKYLLVSNSDAHSPANLAREANIFDAGLSYGELYDGLQNKNSHKLYGTIEFFPEEGKYHFDGHRKCGLCMKPTETIEHNGICPKCGGRITVGVLHRVEELSDREEGYTPKDVNSFISLTPLQEVIGSAMGMSSTSVKAKREYERLLAELGPELEILRTIPIEDIKRKAGELISEGICNLREGKVDAKPGYDGEYGKISVLSQMDRDRIMGQLKLFDDTALKSRPSDSGIEYIKKERADDVQETESYGLNESQWEAVKSTESAVSVTAGPGSGKTKTLVSRIVYLVEKMGVDPSEITAVTFTNKAAGEMKERLEKYFKKSTIRAMNIGTFHSLCLKKLKKAVIVDEAEAAEIASIVIDEQDLALSAKRFISCISLIKNGAGSSELTQDAVERYQEILNERGYMDYDDILINSVDIEHGCPYLLVDEFQDINDLQYKLIKNWSRDSKSIFIIGDPDQAIYGFRGSDNKCFERFNEGFYPVKNIRLTENYRSTPEILGCALSAIGHSDTWLKPNRENGGAVRLISVDSPLSEGIFIAKEINSLVGGINMIDTDGGKKKKRDTEAKGFSDIVVLYRTNRQASIIEDCLQKEGIPYKTIGREDFLREKVVREAIGYFREDKSKGRPADILYDYIKNNGLENDSALNKLLNIAVVYKDKKEFMQAVLLGQEADIVRSGSRAYNPESVTLMTMHGSKGLEFPVVFLAGVNDGVIPYRGFNGDGDIEEELRLFYVGMTRAKDELIMLSGREPSKFIERISQEYIKKETEHRKKKAVQMSLF